MEHGIEGGILGAFVPTLTSENVWNAIYNRFTYGTSLALGFWPLRRSAVITWVKKS